MRFYVVGHDNSSNRGLYFDSWRTARDRCAMRVEAAFDEAENNEVNGQA